MPAYARIAVVTGANKGIGYAIVRNLALQYPTSALNTGPLIIYLGSRSTSNGQSALSSLASDAALKPHLSDAGGPVTIEPASIDISSEQSIQDLAATLKEKHPDGIDILINNAGIAMKGFDTNVVKETLGTNYFGTLNMVNALLPQMKNSSTSRVINVSSIAGLLTRYSKETAARFRNAKTVDDVSGLMHEYTTLVEQGKHEERGFISAAYATSKAGVTGVTKVLGREEAAKGSKILINCCCPGYIMTDMTASHTSGNRLTPDEGATTPVKLALDDLGGKAGEYWKDGEIKEW